MQSSSTNPAGFIVCLFAAIYLCACSMQAKPTPPASALDVYAERYVRLGLAFGEYDPDYVDAYYGPPEWRADARQRTLSLDALEIEAEQLEQAIDAVTPKSDVEAERRMYLLGQLRAMHTRMQMAAGEELPFDVESERLFDAVAPSHDARYFETLLQELDGVLPGKGNVNERYLAYRKRFIISPERVAAVFDEAVAGCRERSAKHIALPGAESFTIEYVKNKPWSGYNWYQGDFRSLIQVNTDLPIYIDRALDLACHEGYPGHHVYNVLLEQHMVRERHWLEFTLNPLYGPQSLISEGSANYGIDLTFPGDERWQWERDHLFALAGLDPAEAEKFYRVSGVAKKLSYAGNEAARAYLSGSMTAEEAARWLEHYALMSPEHARQRVSFIQKYRSYVINYNLGEDLVKAYVESRAHDAGARWQAFSQLLTEPHMPAQLRQ